MFKVNISVTLLSIYFWSAVLYITRNTHKDQKLERIILINLKNNLKFIETSIACHELLSNSIILSLLFINKNLGVGPSAYTWKISKA